MGRHVVYIARMPTSQRPAERPPHLVRRLVPVAAIVALAALGGSALAASKDGWSGGQVPTLDEPSPAEPQIRYEQPRPHVVPHRSDVSLDRKMAFELADGGRLLAIGTIVPGTADRFAEEVQRRGARIKTVVLYSPGGSVRDAIAMGRLIRDKKYTTEVEEGRYCASACPLVFAGGIGENAPAVRAPGRLGGARRAVAHQPAMPPRAR